MGLQIGNILPRKQLDFKDLKGKVIAVDAFNAIYQFLSSIKQYDGTPLMDSEGRITSHLSGLFYRNVSLLSEGLKLVYVFDGEYHDLKGKTHQIRKDARDLAKEKYEQARTDEDIGGMKKYSSSLVRLTSEMLEESKELLKAMGIAVYQAAGEGEMQCASLVKKGEAYAIASQDYDAIAVGGKRLIQNLTLARKRKTSAGETIYISPEVINYEDVLNELDIDGDQLICLSILVGTDFNPGGVKGIGPKKALALVKDKKYPVEIFRTVEEMIDFDWKEVFEIFKKPNVSDKKVEFTKLDEDKIKEILVKRHEFSNDRVENQLLKLRDAKKQHEQSTLF